MSRFEFSPIKNLNIVDFEILNNKSNINGKSDIDEKYDINKVLLTRTI